MRKTTIILLVVGIVFSSYSQVITDGLVGYWPLEGDGTDLSGNNHPSSLFGTEPTVGQFGTALQFDGNDYLEINQNSILNLNNHFTISAWVKFPTSSQNTPMGVIAWGQEDPGTRRSLILWNGNSGTNKAAFSGAFTAANLVGSTELFADQWHHLVVTLESSNRVKIYLDGVLDQEGEVSLSTFTNTNLYIGGTLLGDAFPEYFNGAIDEVYLFNRVILESEITALYNGIPLVEDSYSPPLSATRTPVISDGLVAYWPFDLNANDQSENQLNGEVIGAQLVSGWKYGAYQFNGNDHIVVPQSPSLNLDRNLTVATWVKFPQEKDDFIMSLVAWGQESTGSRRSLILWNNDTGSNKVVFSGFGTNLIGSELTSDEWHHVAFTLDDSDNIKIYLDGQLDQEGTFELNTSPASNLYIGASLLGDSFPEYMYGAIDEVYVFNRLLSDTEINAVFIGTENACNCDELYTNRIGIGTNNTFGYELAVAGKVIAEEVKVKLQSNWPDFVFEDDYPIPPINEVEAYIKDNKHLPGIPSSDEIRKEGLNIGEMDAQLLQKIEELTLYIIELNKQLKIQNEKIQKLEKQRLPETKE